MKNAALRVTALVVFLLAFAGANVGSFLLGRASAGRRVSWQETETIFAAVLAVEEGRFHVEGLPQNDANGRGEFVFAVDPDTQLVWRGTPLALSDFAPGQTVAVTYAGPVEESFPAGISQVLRVKLLDDQLP